jgi:hypothetical protein
MSGGSRSGQGKAEFLRRAAEAYERMVEEDQEQLVTFTDVEDRVLEVGRKLGRFLQEEALARKAARGVGAVRCPKCGREEVELRRAGEQREVEGRAGPVAFRRATYCCPSCRKVFSPSRRQAGTGR